MRVLVACERSGVVRDAFARHGHDAWSCDLAAADGKHLRCDVLGVLGECWDLMIGHPPCTYLCASGLHWTVRGFRDPALTVEAIAFAEALWGCGVPRICIENPSGCLSTRSTLGKATQTVQPYEFGDDASKRTCLWLRGLPALVKNPARRVPGRIVGGKERWSNQTDSGQNRLGPSEKRAMERSRTYPGIAEAMAETWSLLSDSVTTW